MPLAGISTPAPLQRGRRSATTPVQGPSHASCLISSPGEILPSVQAEVMPFVSASVIELPPRVYGSGLSISLQFCKAENRLSRSSKLFERTQLSSDGVRIPTLLFHLPLLKGSDIFWQMNGLCTQRPPFPFFSTAAIFHLSQGPKEEH